MGEDMDIHNVYKGMEREFKDIITSITLRQVPQIKPIASKVELVPLNILWLAMKGSKSNSE